MSQSEISIYFCASFPIDINECSLNSDGCDQLCTNTLGSFQCSCNSGYSLNVDGITCSGRIAGLCVLQKIYHCVFNCRYR